MKHLFYLFFTMAITALSQASSLPDSTTMLNEADSFLRSLPAGMQDKQTEAILKAIDGNSALLENVRNARNIPFPSSPDVETTDIMIPSDVQQLSVPATMIKARLYRPRHNTAGKKLPLLIYLHGGGWTLGSINSCARFCNALAATGQINVLAPDYRLSPEYPYPAAIADAIAVYGFVIAHASEFGSDSQRISLGGDSSGGNLALAASLANNVYSLFPTPAKLLLFYPVVKAYNDNSRSWQTYGHGFGLDSRIMTAFNKAYLHKWQSGNNTSLTPHLASPADMSDSNLKSLPELLLIAAERDILYDQGVDFINHLQSLGINASHMTFPGTTHLFITVSGQHKAFECAVDKSIQFLTAPR